MGLNIQAVEARIGDAVHSVLTELKGAEPAIEAGAEAALLAAGAPAPIAAAAESLMAELLNHFRSETTPMPAPAPQPTETEAPLQVVPANQLSN